MTRTIPRLARLAASAALLATLAGCGIKGPLVLPPPAPAATAAPASAASAPQP